MWNWSISAFEVNCIPFNLAYNRLEAEQCTQDTKCVYRNAVKYTFRILSDTSKLWLNLQNPKDNPHGKCTCSPHSPCLQGCMHGWGLVLCMLYIQCKDETKGWEVKWHNLLLHTNYLKFAEGWRLAVLTWPQGQAIFVLFSSSSPSSARAQESGNN